MLLGLGGGAAVLLSGVLRPAPAPAGLRDRSPARPAVDPATRFTVGGQVVDLDGQGVPDVSIAVWPTDRSQEWTATTGPDGRFALRGVRGVLVVAPAAATQPATQTVWGPRTDLRFLLAERCPLTVSVWSRHDHGAAVAGATVALHTGGALPSTRETDAEGKARWDAVPCGPATIAAEAPGFLADTARVETAEGHGWVHLLPVDSGAVQIHGTVHSDGVPVDQVELATLPAEGTWPSTSGPDGRYSLLVAGPGPHLIVADHHQHQLELDPLLVPPGVRSWAHDVELRPIRKVKVYCAGMPEDGCHDLPLVMCTAPWAPASLPCTEEGGDITCRCPLGEAAVRGGGAAVRVAPDDTEAWLDLRAPGGLSGVVQVDGAPSRCTLEVVQWSLQLAGGGGLRTHACDDDGAFFVPSLQPGDWRVVVRAEGLETAVGPVAVDGAVVDVGVVELTGGAMLAGQVRWEDDGAPVAGVAVAAVALDALADGEAPPVGTATTDAAGDFAIFGLAPGRYEVLLPRDPAGAQVVALGEEDAFVTLERAGGRGLQLGRDGEDRLVVATGDDEGWLRAGDRITAVEAAGVDLLPLLPRYGDGVGETILGMVGWPGLVVEVERAGERVVIDPA